MTSLMVEIRCPACKGDPFIGSDGHGHSYVCEQCEGLGTVYSVKQYAPSPAPPEQGEREPDE